MPSLYIGTPIISRSPRDDEKVDTYPGVSPPVRIPEDGASTQGPGGISPEALKFAQGMASKPQAPQIDEEMRKARSQGNFESGLADLFGRHNIDPEWRVNQLKAQRGDDAELQSHDPSTQESRLARATIESVAPVIKESFGQNWDQVSKHHLDSLMGAHGALQMALTKRDIDAQIVGRQKVAETNASIKPVVEEKKQTGASERAGKHETAETARQSAHDAARIEAAKSSGRAMTAQDKHAALSNMPDIEFPPGKESQHSTKESEQWRDMHSATANLQREIGRYREIVKGGGTIPGTNRQMTGDQAKASITAMLNQAQKLGMPTRQKLKLDEALTGPALTNWKTWLNKGGVLDVLDRTAEDFKDHLRTKAEALGGKYTGGVSSASHPQDSAAIKWAKENKDDPRAAQILKANGI